MKTFETDITFHTMTKLNRQHGRKIRDKKKTEKIKS